MIRKPPTPAAQVTWSRSIGSSTSRSGHRPTSVSPERFNTWPLVSSLVATSSSRLEVGPGLNPRLPIAGTRFVDISEAAVAKLVAGGAHATSGSWGTCRTRTPRSISSEPSTYWSTSTTMTKRLPSFPVSPRRKRPFYCPSPSTSHAGRDSTSWSAMERRYRPDVLLTRLARERWSVEQSGVYGMQPRSTLLGTSSSGASNTVAIARSGGTRG